MNFLSRSLLPAH